VVLSGCHSGPNPSPGLGTALSLRAAFSDILLVGKDHSPQASGLHHPVFDEVACFRPWDELDLSVHRSHLADLLAGPRSVFISGLDLEAHWIAQESFTGALVPPARALDQTRKPHIPAAAGLPFRVPESIDVDAGHEVVYDFCATHGWDAWLKGPAYEARRVRAWSQLEIALEDLEATWGAGSPFFVQEHVPGWEGSIAFSAYQGELLEAVSLEKRLITPEGKSWAGAVSPCDEQLRPHLCRLVEELSWTGGAELEFVRTPVGDLWLIDWNPRFPAWIHGATICGWNLPAVLVACAFDLARPRSPVPASRQFTRVVTEVPVLSDLPLPPPPERYTAKASGKHPSGMPLLMRRTDGPFSVDVQSATASPSPPALSPPDAAIAELLSLWHENSPTPARMFLPAVAERRFMQVASLLRKASSDCGLDFHAAYSIKTNPDRRFLALAKDAGLMAEAISADEVAWAASCGFEHRDLVYNGPMPAATAFSFSLPPLYAVFADSYQSLAELVETTSSRHLNTGARIRPPGVVSRFGIDIADRADFDRLCSALGSAPANASLALSFHAQSSVVGLERWKSLAEALVDIAAAVEMLVGRKIRLIDFGGGWTPSGLDRVLVDGLRVLSREIRDRLPSVRVVILEPGKALCESAVVVVSRVLEVRDGEPRELVVDAGISDLPLSHEKPRQIYHIDGARRASTIPTGRGRILGRLCMEDDVLARRVGIPESVVHGDLIVFSSAGAYDTSMAYRFGRGSESDGGRS
jgi:diaminopimelate decarboxylase